MHVPPPTYQSRQADNFNHEILFCTAARLVDEHLVAHGHGFKMPLRPHFEALEALFGSELGHQERKHERTNIGQYAARTEPQQRGTVERHVDWIQNQPMPKHFWERAIGGE